MGYIYKITNTVNNKAYVGVTIKSTPTDRWNAHKSNIRNGRGCPFLAKAVKKYGEDAFRFEVIIICFDDDVYKYEIDYIKKYNTLSPNGYNVAEGGKSGKNFLGKKHTEETKKIISEKSKEYNNRPEVKERSRQFMIELNKRDDRKEFLKSDKWKKAVEESIIKRTGVALKEDVKKKISEGLKKYYSETTPEFREIINTQREAISKANSRPVSQYSKEGVLMASFDSIKNASEIIGTSRGNIQAVASGRNKLAGGFIWKYDKKEPKE